MNDYRHSLEQTGWKQARCYEAMKKKRPIKGAKTEYEDFISNFRMDVSSELFRLELQASRTESQ